MATIDGGQMAQSDGSAAGGAAAQDNTFESRIDRAERDQRTLFIRNLPFNTVEPDLTQIPEFSNCTIKLPKDRNTGYPRGFGFAEYATIEDCQKAIHDLQNSGIIELQGRELIIVQSSSSTRPGRGAYRGRRGSGGRGGAPGRGRGGYQGQGDS